MITRHHHTSLFVTDLERSIAFYCGALGFELLNKEFDRGGDFMDQVCNHPGTRHDLALLRLGDFVIELMVPLSPADQLSDVDPRDHGIARIGFEVEEIEATVEALRAKGVQFMSEVATLPLTVKHYPGGKAVFFKDPDGIVLELQQPPVPGRLT